MTRSNRTKVSPLTLRAMKAHKTRLAANPEAGRLAALRAHRTRQENALKLARKPDAKREIKTAMSALAKAIKAAEGAAL